MINMFKTKTLWVNVALAVASAVGANVQGNVSPEQVELFGALWALVNIGVRRITHRPATFTAPVKNDDASDEYQP